MGRHYEDKIKEMKMKNDRELRYMEKEAKKMEIYAKNATNINKKMGEEPIGFISEKRETLQKRHDGLSKLHRTLLKNQSGWNKEIREFEVAQHNHLAEAAALQAAELQDLKDQIRDIKFYAESQCKVAAAASAD